MDKGWTQILHLATHELEGVAQAADDARTESDDPVDAPVFKIRCEAGLGRAQNRLIQEDDIQEEGQSCRCTKDTHQLAPSLRPVCGITALQVTGNGGLVMQRGEKQYSRCSAMA